MSLTPRLARVLVAIAVAVPSAPAHAAEIHRWIDGGTVVYSDQPPPAGARVTGLAGREPPPAVAAPDVPPAEVTGPATVDEILEASGIRAQLPSIVAALAADYLPRPGQLAARDAMLVTQVVAHHWAPERVFGALREEFRRRVDARQLEAMAVWFRSPLGRRVTAREIAAAGPEHAPKMAAFAAGFKTSSTSDARLALVQRLDWVTGTSHETTEIGLAIAGSVARAAAAATPPSRRPRAGLVERRIEEMRGRVGATVSGNILTQMLYVYSPLTDDELRQYVDFLASATGRAYGRAAHGALLRIVPEVADQTAIDVLRAVPLARWGAAQSLGGRRHRPERHRGRPLALTRAGGVAPMSRLTADERRRTNELRRVPATRPAASAVMVDELQPHPGWGRGARVATLVTVAVVGLAAVAQLAQTLALYGPASLLDWLLPRL